MKPNYKPAVITHLGFFPKLKTCYTYLCISVCSDLVVLRGHCNSMCKTLEHWEAFSVMGISSSSYYLLFIHRERNTSLPSACDSFPGSAHLTEEQCGINFPFTFGIFLPLFSECAIIVSLFYNSCMSGSQKLATC